MDKLFIKEQLALTANCIEGLRQSLSIETAKAKPSLAKVTYYTESLQEFLEYEQEWNQKIINFTDTVTITKKGV